MGPLGLDLDIDADKGLALLSEPKSGPAFAWNTANQKQGITGGDVIEAVNGVKGSAFELLKLLKETQALSLSMKRFVDYTVVIQTHGMLGLDFVERGERLIVERVLDDGDIHEYNIRCRAGHRVVPGDQIVGVDRMKGKPNELMQKLSNLGSQELALRFRRTPPGKLRTPD